MPVDPVRDAAIDVLIRIFEKGTHLDNALDRTLRRKKDSLSARGKRFMAQLVYGTVRNAALSDFVLRKLVKQPLEKLPLPILVVLRMGIFQSLFCHQVTFPAMVHTSVDLAKRKGHAGTAKLVNAVLHRAPESLDDVDLPVRETDRLNYLSIRHSIPRWIVDSWDQQFGTEECEIMCEASAMEAPHFARTNTLVTTREKLLKDLEKAGHVAEAVPDVPEAIVFSEGPVPLRSQAFRGGKFFIQDPASMLPPQLLEPMAGETILDLCAAPGGKSTHLAQLSDDKATIVACDVGTARLNRVLENIERLSVSSVRPVAADGQHSPFGPGSFDRVLVDAPCTGLGTLRRHPDIGLRVKPGDPERLCELQQSLLRSGVQLCKNGGLIVYAVCTFTEEETEGVIRAILGEGGLELEDGPQWLSRWKIGPGQYRNLPRVGGMDGYFLTRLRKAS